MRNKVDLQTIGVNAKPTPTPSLSPKVGESILKDVDIHVKSVYSPVRPERMNLGFSSSGKLGGSGYKHSYGFAKVMDSDSVSVYSNTSSVSVLRQRPASAGGHSTRYLKSTPIVVDDNSPTRSL